MLVGRARQLVRLSSFSASGIRGLRSGFAGVHNVHRDFKTKGSRSKVKPQEYKTKETSRTPLRDQPLEEEVDVNDEKEVDGTDYKLPMFEPPSTMLTRIYFVFSLLY